MFGCYRRGEANDPDTYVAAVAMVLAKFDVEVIRDVTDPYAGLPGRKTEQGWSGLPDVADVKEACDQQQARRDRLAKYATLPKPMLRLPRPISKYPKPNLFVPQGFKFWDRVLAMHEATPDSPCCFEERKCLDGEKRYGIWCPIDWTNISMKAAAA